MEIKRFKFAVKSVSEIGEFSGYASVFDNIDLGGDIIERGAFKRTIDNQKGKVPILNSHDTHSEIGMTTVLKEDSHGLFFNGQLYIDSADPANEIPDARLAYVRMKNRLKFERPLGMSIGYDVIQKENEGIIRRLKELKLWEISPVTFPMNPSAGISDVKARRDSMILSLDEMVQSFAKLTEEQDSKTIRGQMEQTLKEFQALLEAIRQSDPEKSHSEPDPEPEPAGSANDAELDSFVKSMQAIRAEIAARS